MLAPPDVALASCVLPTGDVAGASLRRRRSGHATVTVTCRSGRVCVGAVGQSFQLDPGASTTIRFVVAWHFPNRAGERALLRARFADAAGSGRNTSARTSTAWRPTRRCGSRTYYDCDVALLVAGSAAFHGLHARHVDLRDLEERPFLGL